MPISRLERQYGKLCDLRDFDDAALARMISAIAPEHSAERPHRKSWEWAMGALFLQEVGALRSDAIVLDVGAGTEPFLFWLAARGVRVVAIDIYGRGAFAECEAARGFPEHPAAWAPYHFAQDRLEVRSMDARRLDFPDGSFDAVVSFSSVEHFGSRREIAAAAGEIGRVLRPGGHAFVTTETFVRQNRLDRRPLLSAVRLLTFGRRPRRPRLRVAGDIFTRRELHASIIGPSRLTLMQPLELDVGPETIAAVQQLELDVDSRDLRYPHVLLRCQGSTFTSVCLPLEKPRATKT